MTTGLAIRHRSPRTVGHRAMRSGALVLALAPIGCSDVSGSADSHAEALPHLVLVEELRIGSVDSPDTRFAAITGVDMDRNGNVYVFEPQAAHIRVYDPVGRLVRVIGRRGEGPGEFDGSPRFSVLGDTVWAFEVFSRRLTLFDRDGTLLTANRIEGFSIQLQEPGSVGWVLPRWMREDGLLVGEMLLYTGARESGDWPVARTDTLALPRVLFTATGDVVDTVGFYPRPPRSPGREVQWVEVGSTRYTVPRPPALEPLTTSLVDGRIVVEHSAASAAEAPAFVVTRLSLAADTIWSRRFTYRPRRYDEALLDSLAWASVRRPGGFVRLVQGVAVPNPVRPDSMAAFEAVRSALKFPEYQPPVQRVEVFPGVEVWLMRESDDGPERWLVLGEDGAARGTVEVPAGIDRVWWSRGDTVWAAVKDELDVPWLLRLRITPRDEAERT